MSQQASDPGESLQCDSSHPRPGADPYQIYARLQKKSSNRRTPGTLILTRYSSVCEAFTNRDLSSEAIPQSLRGLGAKWGLALPDRFAGLLKAALIFSDEQGHGRLRRLLGGAVSPPAIRELRPQIVNRIAQRLDAASHLETIDVIRDISEPLWSEVFGDWLGLPDGDRDHLARNGRRARFMLDLGGMTRDDFIGVFEAVDQLYEFFLHAYRQRDRTVEASLLSRLSEAHAGEAGLDEDQIAFTCIELLVGGNETTQALIGNLLNALLAHPDQLELVRNDRSLLAAAIEETVRFESPLPMVRRVALRDTVITGEPVRQGETVLLCVAAANRDPIQFDEPDRFDIQRKGQRHVGFGYGFHACVGSMFARLQAEVALDLMLRRFPHLERAEPAPAWQKRRLTGRALERLPIRVCRPHVE
ncbi:MAG: cytochrome P450 [Inquilinus sp.]|uniref:cytochrome P450 n=1 Tax=Inquilinus sp. TaxID=1932117 RepID=UPI003F3AB2F4